MSKVLNRIAPQDEILLETDVGTMIPSAEQLAEERVTRFKADKEIRLRVKALEESGSAIEEAKAAAEQASKAAQQAEDAKDAIGDVGGRLDAVETSVEGKAPKITKGLLSGYDYEFASIKTNSVFRIISACHDGLVIADQYNTREEFHLSSSGKVTKIPRILARASYKVFFNLAICDLAKGVTQIYSLVDSKKYLLTISGSGDNITATRTELDAFPNEAIDAYSNVIGYASGNGFYVCNGKILNAELTEVSVFNCRAYFDDIYLFNYGLPIVKEGDAYFYYDTSVRKSAKLTLDDGGIPTMEYNSYAQDSSYTYTPLRALGSMLRFKFGITERSNGNGHFYGASQQGYMFKMNGATSRGLVCNGKELFSAIDSANNIAPSMVQRTFGLVDTFTVRSVMATCLEDFNGNVFVCESGNFIYQAECEQHFHIFRRK